MKKKSLNALVIFTQQFASLTRAKLPILNSIKNLEKETIYPSLKVSLQKVIKQVERGINLDEALKVDGKVFDSIYISMVKAGMDSGSIDVTLTELSKYLTKSAKIANKVTSALTYPFFLFLTMLGVITLMLIKIIPMFKEIFEKANKELPNSTQIAINISDFIMEHYLLIFVGITILSILVITLIKTKGGKRLLDSIKLKLPFFKNLIKQSAISRFVRTLGILTKANIPILEAIKTSKTSSKNVIIEEKIDEVIKLINRGEAIADSLKEVNKDVFIFPEIVIQVVSSGEEGGDLDRLLIDLADYYDDQIDNELDGIISIINPIITVVMGVFILFLMVAIFEPIFRMGDTISY